jgi:hypothetical protein
MFYKSCGRSIAKLEKAFKKFGERIEQRASSRAEDALADLLQIVGADADERRPLEPLIVAR